MGIYYMPGAMLGTMCVLSDLIVIINISSVLFFIFMFSNLVL